MSKVRIVYKLDKSVAVIHPAPSSKREDETEGQWLKRVFNKAMRGEFEGLEYDDVDTSELPQLREDREAWEGEKGKGIIINQVKANKLKAEKLVQEKIQNKIKAIAIKTLKNEGELPIDYAE